MDTTIEMSSDTTTVKLPKYRFERLMLNALGGYSKGASVYPHKEGSKTTFVIRTYPHTYITQAHVVGEWERGTGTYCNRAVKFFKRS